MCCEALLSLWYGVSESEEGKDRDWRSPGLSATSRGWSGPGIEREDCRRPAPGFSTVNGDDNFSWNRSY